MRENLRLTLKERTIIILAWISKRQKIGSKKKEDRNFCELRAKMVSESQRLCGFRNRSVEMEESRLRELLHNYLTFFLPPLNVVEMEESRLRELLHFTLLERLAITKL